VLETSLFEIQDRELIQQAISEYRRGRADFSDYLIGRENLRAGCSDTITFDGELAKVDRFSLLSTS
jgi:predicted nucleic-acid-binding protein